MALFKRKKPDGVGLGKDVSGIEDEAAASVAVPAGVVTPPSEDPDAPPPPQDASDNLEALIRETDGGPSATGRARLSKEERAERSRLGKEAKAAARAERAAARVARREASGAVTPGGAARKGFRAFALWPRKAAASAPAETGEEFEPIVGEPDTRLSASVVIEFLQGYAKDDAVTWAKRWAADKMTVPSDCYYFVTKYPGGYAVEIQEGVGQAYLPSAISLATRNPGRMVIVPMSRRKMTVRFTERTEDFSAYILPEGQEPAATGTAPLFAVRSAKMKPIMQQNLQWLYAGVGTSVVGGLFLLSSLMVYAFDPGARVPPEWRTTAIPRLPVMQWNRLQPDATDSYVVRMEFSDGQWRIIRQAAGATAEVATPDAAPDAAIVGGAVAAPTTPDASGGAIPPPPPAGVVVTPSQGPGGAAAGAVQPPRAGAAGSVPTQIPPPAGAARR
jgi:hypothetical protein